MAPIANTIITKITSARAKELYGNLAQNNYYQVHFADIPSNLKIHLNKITFNNQDGFDITNFVSRDLGLLCTDASLPSSSYATSEVKDNYMGVTQEFPHTRLYTDVDFTFYVDTNYNTLRFFEGWMDYISGGNKYSDNEDIKEPAASSVLDANIYRRFNYPSNYKVNTMYIAKFNRDVDIKSRSPVLVYSFVNAFPKSISSIPVSYGSADILKVSVTFNYDRYIVSKQYVNNEEESKTDSSSDRVISIDRPFFAGIFNTTEELERFYKNFGQNNPPLF